MFSLSSLFVNILHFQMIDEEVIALEPQVEEVIKQGEELLVSAETVRDQGVHVRVSKRLHELKVSIVLLADLYNF